MSREPLTVNGERLLSDLFALAEIGATEEGGVSRPALSDADLRARDWLRARAADVGLESRIDAVGNVSVLLPAQDKDAQTVLLGSHLDTVPNGGRYDGALGVISALETLRTIKEAELSLPWHLEVISFVDEEGTWLGMLGSRGVAGTLTAEDFEVPRKANGSGFQERLDRAGIRPEVFKKAKREPETLRAWIEVHVEQALRLEELDIPIGIVTAIVGIDNLWLTFHGQADHAGTTPMDARRDALQGAGRFATESRALVMERFDGAVMNCGIVEVSPGAFNIVPQDVRMSLEFRHSDAEKLVQMRKELLALAERIAKEEDLQLTVQPLDKQEPVSMDDEVAKAIEEACETLGVSSVRVPSYAGHDTQVMALVTPAAMFFVPSVGGVSHRPDEYTQDEHCVLAANVMLQSVLSLASEH